MSECVVRMERVPRNCDDGCWGSLSGECPWCDSIDGYKMVGNRPPNCPIICQLPEGHGRLVDASTVMGAIRLEDLIRKSNVPTIVPSERRPNGEGD